MLLYFCIPEEPFCLWRRSNLKCNWGYFLTAAPVQGKAILWGAPQCLGCAGNWVSPGNKRLCVADEGGSSEAWDIGATFYKPEALMAKHGRRRRRRDGSPVPALPTQPCGGPTPRPAAASREAVAGKAWGERWRGRGGRRHCWRWGWRWGKHRFAAWGEGVGRFPSALLHRASPSYLVFEDYKPNFSRRLGIQSCLGFQSFWTWPQVVKLDLCSLKQKPLDILLVLLELLFWQGTQQM